MNRSKLDTQLDTNIDLASESKSEKLMKIILIVKVSKYNVFIHQVPFINIYQVL